MKSFRAISICFENRCQDLGSSSIMPVQMHGIIKVKASVDTPPLWGCCQARTKDFGNSLNRATRSLWTWPAACHEMIKCEQISVRRV